MSRCRRDASRVLHSPTASRPNIGYCVVIPSMFGSLRRARARQQAQVPSLGYRRSTRPVRAAEGYLDADLEAIPGDAALLHEAIAAIHHVERTYPPPLGDAAPISVAAPESGMVVDRVGTRARQAGATDRLARRTRSFALRRILVIGRALWTARRTW